MRGQDWEAGGWREAEDKEEVPCGVCGDIALKHRRGWESRGRGRAASAEGTCWHVPCSPTLEVGIPLLQPGGAGAAEAV